MTEANKTYLGFSVQNDTKAGLQEIKNDVRSVAETAVQAGQRAASAFDGMGRSGEEAAVKLTRSESAIAAALRRSIEQMELAQRQAAGMADAFDFKIGFRGIDTSKLQPAIDHLRQLEAQISVTKAAEAELAAQNAFAIKHQQATELAKASQYASWWAAELDKVEAAERKLASETAFLKSLKAQTDAIGKTRADLLEMQAAQMGVSSQAAPFIAKLRETEQGLGKMGQSAGQTRMALQQLPLQFQDIVVSLQAGQAPLTVFLQQGSQIAGSFGGANAALKAMANYVWGLVNPYTVAAAVIGTVALAYYQGSKEQDTFVRSLTMTGNAVGMTTDQLRAYSREISESVGTQGRAAQALVAFIDAGMRGNEQLQEYAKTAMEWESVTGQAVTDVAKQFKDLQDDPLKAVVKLNEGMNFLTVSVYEQIKSLEEQGKKTEAAQVAMDALNSTMKERSAEIKRNLGYIEGAWNAITGAAKNAWDAMLNIGRDATSADTLSAIRKELADLQSRQSAGFGETGGGAATGRPSAEAARRVQERINQLKAEETQLLANIEAEKKAAEQKAKEAEAVKTRISINEKYADALKVEMTLSQKLAQARKDAADAGWDEEKLKRVLAHITEEHNKKNREGVSAIKAAESAYKSLLTAINGKIAAFEKEHTVGEKLTETEKLRIKYQEELATRKRAFTATQQAHIEQMLDAAEAAEQEAIAARELAKAWDADAKALEAYAKKQEAQIASVISSTQKLRLEEEAHLLAESANISHAEAVERLTIARLEEAQAQMIAGAGSQEEIERITREIEARKELLTLLGQKSVREANAKAAKEAAKDWEKTSQTIGQTLSDYIMSGGQDAATYLKRLFANLVLQPIVKAGVNDLMSLVGLGGGGANSGGSSLMSTITNMLSTGKSVYSAFTGQNTMLNTVGGWLGIGSSAALNTASATALQASATNLSAAAAELATGSALDIASAQALSASAESLASGAAANAAGSSSWMSTAWPLAIVAGMIMSSKLYKSGIDQDSRQGFGKTIGIGNKIETDILAKIVGNQAANILTGAPVMSYTLNALFGRKLKDAGIEGTFGDGGFVGNSYEFHKGGLFKSDKTYRKALDSGTQEWLDDTYQAIKASTSVLAESVGISAGVLDGVTHSMKLSLKGLTDAEIDEAFGVEFGKITQAMADAALASENYSVVGETSVETLTRLASSLLTVNELFDQLGLTLIEAGISGAEGASGFLGLFGGADNARQVMSAYYQDYYSEAERMQKLREQVNATLKDMGVAPLDALDAFADNAKERFRAELEHVRETSQMGVLAAMMQLAPTFAQVADYAEREFGTAADAITAAAAAMAELRAEAQGIVDAQRDSLDSLIASLHRQEQLQSGGFIGNAWVSGDEFAQFSGFADQLDGATAALAELEALGLGDEMQQYADAIGEIVQQTKELLAAELSASRLRAGDFAGALAAAISASLPSYTEHLRSDGSFNAGSYNDALTRTNAQAAADLAGQLSASALRIAGAGEGFAGYMQGIVGSEYSGMTGVLTQEFRQGLRQDFAPAIADALSATLEKVVVASKLEAYMPSGPGLASIAAAQRSYGSAAASDYVHGYGTIVGAQNIAYAQSLTKLDGLLSAGKITADEYADGVAAINNALGDLSTTFDDVTAAIGAAGDAAMQLSRAGLDSVNYYFTDLSAIVAEMDAAAAKANTPLAQAVDVIGLLDSTATAFGQSAAAALSGAQEAIAQYLSAAESARSLEQWDSVYGYEQGARDASSVYAAMQGSESRVSHAQLVADAAAIASGIMTTASAAQAAEALAGKLTLGEGQTLRDLSLLVDGVKEYDNAAFYEAFARVSDALGKGDINSEQYGTLFDYLLTTYDGSARKQAEAAEAAAKSLKDLRAAAGSLADELLLSDLNTAFGTPQRAFEADRQYAEVLRDYQAGTATESELRSVTTTMLKAAQDAAGTPLEYERKFGQVIAQMRSIEGGNAVSPEVKQMQLLQQAMENEMAQLRRDLAVALAAVKDEGQTTNRLLRAEAQKA